MEHVPILVIQIHVLTLNTQIASKQHLEDQTESNMASFAIVLIQAVAQEWIAIRSTAKNITIKQILASVSPLKQPVQKIVTVAVRTKTVMTAYAKNRATIIRVQTQNIPHAVTFGMAGIITTDMFANARLLRVAIC